MGAAVRRGVLTTHTIKQLVAPYILVYEHCCVEEIDQDGQIACSHFAGARASQVHSCTLVSEFMGQYGFFLFG
jgi:hypothetical protein